jgi:hypothetical protein
MANLQNMLATSKDVLALSREEIAGYVLESLNSDQQTAAGGKVHTRNYMRGIKDLYGADEVVSKVQSAWRWAADNEYLTEDVDDTNPGWYRLTAKGRAIRTHTELQVPRVPRAANPGPAPNFSPITSDGLMQKHLIVLWEEAVMCTNGDAYLSAIVMLGGFLEGVLLGKCMDNVALAHAAPSAPKTKGKPEPWQRWNLTDFIDVALECGWIHQTRGDFTDQLRGYRNLVHPYKSYNIGYRADEGLVNVCWAVVRATMADLGVTTT